MCFITCENAIEKFNPEAYPACNNGDVTVEWFGTAPVNTGNRAYQREKVASTLWKQNILRTILVTIYAGIPEIHIRVMKTETGYKFEVVDGQQRVSAPLGFLAGDFPMPNNIIIDGMDISGMYIDELKEKYPSVVERLKEYRIACKWYEGLTDAMTSHLYVNVLNNVNDQKPQEIRNAVLGFYSDYVRNVSRFEDLHDLFTRITVKTKKSEKTQLKYFSSKFALKGRMEVDEWLSELAYLKLNGVRKGVTQPRHTQWVKDIQSPNGKYIDMFTDKKTIDGLLNLALSLFKATPEQYKVRLNAMTAMMLVLYADDINQRFGKIIPEKFAPAFFDVYTRWSDPAKGLYVGKETFNGSVMPPFKELFGGKNSNAERLIINNHSENAMNLEVHIIK